MLPSVAEQLGFGNGRLEEFYVHCKCLTPEQMREPEVSCALAVRGAFAVTSAMRSACACLLFARGVEWSPSLLCDVEP